MFLKVMDKKITIIFVVILLAVAAGIYFFRPNIQSGEENLITEVQPDTTEQDNEEAVRAILVELGQRARAVPLYGSTADTQKQMKTWYADYISSDLLAAWQTDRSKALGKTAETPWPDRIEISFVTKNTPNSYLAQGNVIEVGAKELTEGKAARRYLVLFQVDKIDEQWKVVAFDKGPYELVANQ